MKPKPKPQPPARWSIQANLWLWAVVIALACAMAFLVRYLTGLVDSGTIMSEQVLVNRAAILTPADSVTWRWQVSDAELVQKEFHPRSGESDREFCERVIVNVKEWKDMTAGQRPK